jgi:hypothetical protein
MPHGVGAFPLLASFCLHSPLFGCEKCELFTGNAPIQGMQHAIRSMYSLFQLLTKLDVKMTKNTRLAFVATALALASSASMALSANLGTLTSSGTYFGNTFSQAVTTFTDTYTFQVASTSNVVGAVTDYAAEAFQLFSTTVYFRDVNISKLELFGNGVSVFIASNVPDTYTFQFSNLSANVTYKLALTGSVSSSIFGAADTATYDGFIASTPSVASGAPEASDALMAAMGLVGVGFWARARKSAAK